MSASGAGARYAASPPAGTRYAACPRVLQVAARAATHDPAIATRARGCHDAREREQVARERRLVEPERAHPPDARARRAAGVTCGLAARKSAVVSVTARASAGASHSSVSTSGQRPRAADTVIPVRTPARAAARETAHSRAPSTSATARSSHGGDWYARRPLAGVPDGGDDSGSASCGCRSALAASARRSRSRHTAAIGNLGMRTHAMRQGAFMHHLHRSTTSTLLHRDPSPASRRARRAAAARRPSAAAAASSSAATTNAEPASRASRASRTATALETGGAPSSTTSANAPERSNRSAHHAPRAARSGRIIQSAVPSPPPRRATAAQSRGASVRAASTYATQSPRCDRGADETAGAASSSPRRARRAAR